jgi:hypothetical protein
MEMKTMGNETVEHELKTWPEFFQAVLERRKTFELRKDDRGFKVGDLLWLQEWDRVSGYSGRSIVAEITYISRDSALLPPGYVAMSIVPPDGETCFIAEQGD